MMMSRAVTVIAVCVLVSGLALFVHEGLTQETKAEKEPWIENIEKVFVRSEVCRQCHNRHYEEMAGLREMTTDLKLMGKVDAALLHGTALPSQIFKTVLGVWLQTKPTAEQRQQCLSCHAPAVTVFPESTDRIINQVLTGKVSIEGISCSSCHLVNQISDDPKTIPAFHILPEKTMFGPFKDAEENMVHNSHAAAFYKGANFCTACHFEKVRDHRSPTIESDILEGVVCQSCHMEQTTGSSTSKRGSMTREIGRHYFRGTVIPGLMLRSRNLQAEWMPRLEIKTERTGLTIQGDVAVMNGAVPHAFPDGDPVLKQFYLSISVRDQRGHVLGSVEKTFGNSYADLLAKPLGDSLVKGGTTKHIPFTITLSEEGEGMHVDALLTYGLIPRPEPELLQGYLKTLSSDAERENATRLLSDYSASRVLTFRTKSL